jgi:hypothetical protein
MTEEQGGLARNAGTGKIKGKRTDIGLMTLAAFHQSG